MMRRKEEEPRVGGPSSPPEASDPETEEKSATDQQVAKKSGPPPLSFNAKLSPDMVEYLKPSDEELEETKRTDPRLHSPWTIWEMKEKGKKKDDFDSGSATASFSTVKGFWKHWNHLPQPSELFDGKKFMRETREGKAIVEVLMLFRDNVKPEWEYPANATGGHFQMMLNYKVGPAQIDEYWNNLVLGMVADTIKPAGMITGVRLVDKLGASSPLRQHIRIELWYSDHKDTAKVDLLQESVEKCMSTKVDGTTERLPKSVHLERKKH